MRGGRAFLDVDDGAFDLVACTDAHDGPHGITWRAAWPAHLLMIDKNEKAGSPSKNRSRSRRDDPDISACSGRMKSASLDRRLLLGVRSGQYLAAGGRQLRQGHRRFWLWRLFRRLRVDNRILEPIGQIAGAATFARRWFRLALATAGASRTFDADMEVVVVAVHRPHLMEPAAVALGFAAKRFLDRGVDEDALHARLLRGRADHREMARGPGARIDVEPVGTHHHDRGRFLALFARQSPVRHRRQPDIGVEAYLVAGVPGQHRTAARLRHVADQYPRPARSLPRLLRQSLAP